MKKKKHKSGKYLHFFEKKKENLFSEDIGNNFANAKLLTNLNFSSKIRLFLMPVLT